MKPFYRYLGGKSKEIKYFKDLIPEFKYYIEPFFGGGAVFWELEPKFALINDSDEMLMKFLQTVKETPEVFDQVVDYWPCTKEMFLKVRDDWKNYGELAEVQRYFYFLRTSFNGFLRFNAKKGKYNMSFGNKKAITPIPKENVELLKNAYICSTDAFEILKNPIANNNPDSFIFLDPPYDGLFNYLYDSSDKSGIREILEKIKEFMSTNKTKTLLTIGSSPYTEELFKGMITRRYTTKLTFGAHCKGKNLSKETLVITNY